MKAYNAGIGGVDGIQLADLLRAFKSKQLLNSDVVNDFANGNIYVNVEKILLP